MSAGILDRAPAAVTHSGGGRTPWSYERISKFRVDDLNVEVTQGRASAG
jgi:hypothetical protein